MTVIILVLCAGLLSYLFFPETELPAGITINRIEVYKSKRKMKVFSKDILIKTYTISLGKNPVGKKEFEGDCKTPEGIYFINDRNANSGYHKNLGISYPNDIDEAHAARLGKPVGGHIKIHGLPNGKGFLSKFQRWTDWTAGCIAVTNSEIDELYVSVADNASIQIFP